MTLADLFPKKSNKSASRMTRSRKNRITYTIAAILLAAASATVYIADVKYQNKQDEALAPKEPVSYQTATISAVGDIALDDALLADAVQEDGTYDFTPYFLNAAPLLYGADLTIGNLELTFSGEPYGGDTFSAPESLAGTLHTLGFDLVQTANSKTVAGGISGLKNTISVLSSNGIETVGTYTSQYQHDHKNVRIKEVNGIRFAFIAYTKGFDGMSIPEGSEYCTNLLYEDYNSQYTTIDTEQIVSCIDAAKAENPDVIISLVHWGSIYKKDISETQQRIADLMFENGVDVILGTHSHIVSPIEMREIEQPDGTTKQGLLAYSLGNFLSSDQETNTQESLVLNLSFSKDEATGTVSISDVNYVPLYIVDNGKRAKNRYELLDIYRSIDLYNTSYLGRVSDEVFEELNSAIEILKTNTNTDYDRGPIAE